MKSEHIPKTDSIQELAQFWDTHDLTDFENELEEVIDDVSDNETSFTFNLHRNEAEVVVQIAQSKGFQPSQLIQIWVAEKIRSTQFDQPAPS
jgi:hypothetical protein